MPEMYKIRNREGLFSTGGTSPRFSTDGKTWHKRGHLSNHLAQFNKGQLFRHYAGCEVVTFRIEVDGAESIERYLEATVKRQEDRKAEMDRIRESYRREAAERKLKELLKEFPDLGK